MGNKDRETACSVITYTGRKQSANFFQLVENLACYHDIDLSNIDKFHINETLFRFSTAPSVSFPTADIKKIEVHYDRDNIKQYLIETTFLGLHGASSPLPGTYLDQIAYEYAQGSSIKHQYFDFFNHRLQTLLLKSWRKYKYYINYKHGIDDDFSKKLFAFIGVDNRNYHVKTNHDSKTNVQTIPDNLEGLDWHKLLYFMGVLVSRVRSPSMVEKIISHYFNLDKVKIKEWQKQKITLQSEQTNSLGKANVSLSDTFILGNEVTSYAKKFVIVLDELSLEQFYDFLPNGAKHLILKKLILFLMKDLLPYDIHLGIKLDTVPDFILGNCNHSLLGWTTFMNTGEKIQTPSRVTITGQV